MAPAKKQAAKSDHVAADVFKLILNSAKTIVLVTFGIIGITFLLMNWNQMSDILNGVSRIEAFGFKVELSKKATIGYEVYNKLLTVRPDLERPGRSLSKTEFRAILLRAIWAQPVLDGANILWVDDEPESYNAEAQLLSYHKVAIFVARNTQQALDLLKLKQVKFHLVVSDIFRRSDKKGELENCPVYWDTVPNFGLKAYGTEDLATFNEKYNKDADAGFYLAERMNEELAREDRPPIIYYSGYYEGIFNPCADAITNEAYPMMSAMFNLLFKERWTELEKYNPLPEPKGPISVDLKATKQAETNK